MGNLSCCQEDAPPKLSEVAPAAKRRPRFNDHLKTVRKAPKHTTPSPPTRQSTAPLSPRTPCSACTRGPWNYQSRKLLGRGEFGCVVLAEEKESGQEFAMKIIEKGKIKEFNVLQSELLRQMGKQQFLVATKETFQNQTHIYLVMEYLPKGDLYYYLRRREINFSEALICAITAEIVSGINVLHSFGVIYRELKPENLLVTQQGHIKLADYGLSKVMVQDGKKVSTFVGSLEYMPPQALEGNGQYGQKADLWALGVLMFQLHFRESPFGEDIQVEDYRRSMQTNAISERINTRIGYMSSAYRDLLLRLLEKDPDQRISLQEVRSHQFFKEISWANVDARLNPPPLKSLIEKHDSISFRDAANEQYSRKRIAKRTPRDSYEIKLFEFRNSQ